MAMPASQVSRMGPAGCSGQRMRRAGGVSLSKAREGGGGGRGLREGVMCPRVSPAFAEAQVHDT